MTGGNVLLALLAFTAVWPFNRDKREAEGTIKSLEAVEIEVDTDAPIQGGDEKAIESYRSFLELASDDPLLRAEAMRRLADLQLEAHEAEQLRANVESLRGAFDDTIALYEQLLESYPRYAKNDLVLYQLARAYEASGQPEQALATLDRLIAQYPDTPHYDEAQFRRGETLFVAKRYAEAEDAYAHVLARGPSSQFYEQSLYKHGWAQFKQLEHAESLDSFFALLDVKLGAGTDGGEVDPAAVYARMGRAEQELVEDTLRVLSISFSYLGGPEAVTEYFATHGPRPYSYIVYTNLGDLYLDQERYQDAADAYLAFVELDPYHAKAPLLAAETMEAYKAGGFADLVLEAKQGFVERYGPGSPYWQRWTYEQQPEVVALLKSNVTDLAAYHHAEAQASHDPAEYVAAARWYRSYLQSFPDDQDAPRTHFLLSEVLYESGAYRDAALEYERTAYGYPFHEHAAEAGYAALLAYAKHEESLAGAARAAWHRQGIESALRFVATYPAHEQAAAVQTDAAEKLFALGEFARARDVALGVTARQPPPEPALLRTAWTVVAHSEFDLGDFAAAEAAYLRLAAMVPADDPDHGQIVERIASSIYKQGEQARDAGAFEEAVAHFLRVGEAAPTSTIRATAEYDAAAALIQAGDWARATAVLQDFRTRFPDHELADEVTANLAVAYVETGDNGRAASEFERIADGDGPPEVKQEALWRAADLYAQTGQTALAASAFERYVQRYPSPVGPAMEARQRLVELATAQGDYAARSRWLRALVEADAAAGPERTDRTRYLAAKAQLALAEAPRDAFRGVRLVVPLDRSLQAKRTQMEQALAAYGKAADYGVAEVTTAANYEIAELYHELARALMASERPPDLSPEELEQYDILLEEQAFPFEEEAIELHELNAARTAEGLYDEWIEKSLAALAELMPARYDKREIGETQVVLAAAASSAEAEAEPPADQGRRERRRRRGRDERDEARAELPESLLASHRRALAAIEAGDLVEAELELEQITLEHPGYAAPYVNLAIVYRAGGRDDEARAALEQALAVEPGHAAANNLLGILLREAGRFPEAEQAYRRALETSPEYALAHHNLGVLLDVYMHRRADALEHYERYQRSLAVPDEAVARWIIDLRRRLGVTEEAAQVARGDAQ
ncbi:MAG TPA: tetratricopeptide repeat protein [Gammaproteobacteria bacterium]